MTFDSPLHAPWCGPSACPRAGSRVWRWPAGGAVSGPPTAESPAHEEEQPQHLHTDVREPWTTDIHDLSFQKSSKSNLFSV